MVQYGLVSQWLALVQWCALAHDCIATAMIELRLLPVTEWHQVLIARARRLTDKADSELWLDFQKLAISRWPSWALLVRLRLQAHCQCCASSSTWNWSFKLPVQRQLELPLPADSLALLAHCGSIHCNKQLLSWIPVPSLLVVERQEEEELLAHANTWRPQHTRTLSWCEMLWNKVLL
jgi:hypothetical protein